METSTIKSSVNGSFATSCILFIPDRGVIIEIDALTLHPNSTSTMKIAAFFMATMVLLLSVRPCNDRPVPENGDTYAKIIKSHSHQDSDNSDLCSPFCCCSCCCSVSVTKIIATQETPVADIPAFYQSLYTGSLSEIALPIWQPPQLAA